MRLCFWRLLAKAKSTVSGRSRRSQLFAGVGFFGGKAFFFASRPFFWKCRMFSGADRFLGEFNYCFSYRMVCDIIEKIL
jgi:hypothetical protein